MAEEKPHRIYVDDIDTELTVRALNPAEAVKSYRGSLNAYCYGHVTAELCEERDGDFEDDRSCS